MINDTARIRRVVDALAGLPWEEKIAFAILAMQAETCMTWRIRAEDHRPALDKFSNTVITSLAQAMLEILNKEAAPDVDAN